jgi:hypothetical protein
LAALFLTKNAASFSQEDLNEQACDLVVAVGALALAFVTLSPNSAEAGWRRWGWGWGPGVNVHVGPRYGWYGYRPYYRPYAYYYGYPYGYYPYWRGRYWRGWY